MLFDNGVFHKVLLELVCDDNKKIYKKAPSKNSNEQAVYSEGGIKTRAVWLGVNGPPHAGEGRFLDWQPHLQASPPGAPMNHVVVMREDVQPKLVKGSPQAGSPQPIAFRIPTPQFG